MKERQRMMENELAMYKRRYEEEQKSGQRMANRIRSYQGVITKLKKGYLKGPVKPVKL